MSERYTQLSVDKTRLYIPDSPVVLEAQALLKDNVTGEAIAQLKFKNISQTSIKALTIGLKCFDVMGEALEGVNNFQILDLNAQRDKTFGQNTPIPLPDKNTRSFEVINFSIVFQDGSIWVSEDEIEWLKLPGRISLASGLGSQGLASQYKRDIVGKTPKKLEETWSSITGTKIVHERIEPITYPWEFEDIWCCTCGFDNHKEETICHHCSLSKTEVFESLNLDVLNKHKREYEEEIARKKAIKDASKHEKRERRKAFFKNNKTIIVGIAIALFVVGLFALFLLNACSLSNSFHTSTIQEIDKKANSIGNESVRFAKEESQFENSEYDFYSIIFGNNDVGEIYLYTSGQEIRIYVDSRSKNAMKAFPQITISAMMACDPSLSYEQAKSIFNRATTTEKAIKNNGITYESDDSGSINYVTKIHIPENLIDS